MKRRGGRKKKAYSTQLRRLDLKHRRGLRRRLRKRRGPHLKERKPREEWALQKGSMERSQRR